jgi:hypothetical protein
VKDSVGLPEREGDPLAGGVMPVWDVGVGVPENASDISTMW